MREPELHTGYVDCLPEAHPLAYRSVTCDRCQRPIHAANNECMWTWVETGKGNYCLPCFVALDEEDGTDPAYCLPDRAERIAGRGGGVGEVVRGVARPAPSVFRRQLGEPSLC